MTGTFRDADAPRVSVLVCVHNGQAYLEEALESLRTQTFRDFEVVAVDDGSTDATAHILEARASKRLRPVRLPRRQGLTRALNAGWDLCRGAYLARLDADDRAHPERLARQTAFLDANPEVVACGTWVTRVAQNGAEEPWRAPLDHEGIVSELLFRSPIAHPTAMLRRQAFEDHGLRYDPAYRYAQDYALWLQASRIGKLANLGAPLLHFRVHRDSVSVTRRAEQDACARRVRRIMFGELGLRTSRAAEALHDRIIALEGFDPEGFAQAVAWLEALDARNQDVGRFPKSRFRKVAGGYLRALAERAVEREAALARARRSVLLEG